MTTTSYLWLAAILGAGLAAIVALFVGGLLLDRWAARPMERGGAHRAEEPLPPTHVELIRPVAELEPDTDGSKSTIIEPDGTPTRPVPGQPVEHAGATEDWSPTAELAVIPVRSLDPDQAEAEELHDQLDRIERHARAAIARVGHLEQDTCSWTADEVAALVAAARAGAR